MLRKILVPLDGSTTAEAILPRVAELARTHDGEVVLLRVTVAPNYPYENAIGGERRNVEEAERYLQKVAQELRGQGLRIATVVGFSGSPAEEILGQADIVSADLIAMSTHGRTGLTRWALGSVAERVVRASPTPVLLVRSPSPPGGAVR